MIIIENKILRAVISSKGAELQSLFNKETGIEHMWSGAAAWPKHSPVLFPIVGSLKNDTYYYQQNSYHLPRHGFAREKTFLQEQVNNEEALFTLTNDADTIAVYPFLFSFAIRYTLLKNTLICSYHIINTDIKEMLFSVGAHPAFAVPMIAENDYNEYYLEFNKTEELYQYKLENGLISAHKLPLPIVNKRLNLNHSIFYEDAIVIKNMQSQSIILGCNYHPHGIKFNFENFPFFGIWAAKDADFVCLEPWCGIADSVNANQQLTDKEGVINLRENEEWQRSWSVDCF